LKVPGEGSIWGVVIVQKLFALLVAVAVLLAPGLTGASMAQAAQPDHHAQMTEKSHCDPARDDQQRGEAHDMSCCAAMCMAVAVTPAVVPLGAPLQASETTADSLFAFAIGTPAELATPPPRAA
jgi:hypothetical protein